MLALPSLELARAQRHKKPLLSCRTNSLQIAAAALQAATVERAPILITLDATLPTTLPHIALLSGILELGRDAKVQVAVEVVVPTSREAASWWIDHGVLAVTLHGTADAIKRTLKHVQLEALAHGAEVGIEPTDITTLRAMEALAGKHDAHYIRLAPREKLSEMHEYCKAVEVPVIAGGMHISAKKSRDLITAGCVGLTLSTELNEAFTAGIRTALRSRSECDPSRYLGYGATAVRELVKAHYAYFHTS